MIRAVLFDFDGTLYDRDAVILRLARLQYAALQKDLKGINENSFLDHVVRLDAHGHQRTPRLHHHLAAELELPESVADQLEAFFREHYPTAIEVTQDTRSALENMKNLGLKLGIITNGPEVWQSRKITGSKLASLFDTIVISGKEGIEKPDPRIFERALQRCGVEAKESIFVGDHPIADIQGAQNAGLRAVWKRMEYWEVPEDVPRIDRISEVLDLV